jgi:O-glycosyl hydrolase
LKTITYYFLIMQQSFCFLSPVISFRKLSLLFMLLCFSYFGKGQNLIVNGSFEANTTNWNNLSSDGASTVYTVVNNDAVDGSHSLRVAVATLGANTWSIQSIHSGWPSVQNEAYVFSFYAKAATAGATLRVVLQNATYASRDFVLSTSWQRYEWAFTAQEDNLQLKFNYIEPGTFFLDHIQILSPSALGDLTISVDYKKQYQQMVGFGGALTWHCDRITRSPHKNEIAQLIYEDLGTDIVRFKNWYYPTGYPANKSTTNMEVNWFKPHFDATQELHTLAKQHNPDIEVLLSSWSPPSSLKSNNDLNEGTLRKNGSGQFMYPEFAQYWNDVLDNVGFDPEYISIQNEPGFVTSGWSTCEFRPIETATVAGYDQLIEHVYESIKNRSDVPKIIGPETENIGNAFWNSSLNTYREFSAVVKNKPYLAAYAYHLYNYGNTPGNQDPSLLHMIRDEFDDAPNFMTEFSGENYNWLYTADIIHETVTKANAAAYIYWELMWDETSGSALVRVDNDGNYTIGEHYYALKHFAKHIDKGYHRVDLAGDNLFTKVSAYLHPSRTQLTLVAVNTSSAAQGILLDLGELVLTGNRAYQSVAHNFYQDLGILDLTDRIELPANSVTTFVIDMEDPLPVEVLSFGGKREGSSVLLQWTTADESGIGSYKVERSEELSGGSWTPVATVAAQNQKGIHTYQCTDAETQGQAYYYRLWAIEEADGQAVLKGTIYIQNSGLTTMMKAFPNPAHTGEGTSIWFSQEVLQKTSTITVSNLWGQTIETFSPQHNFHTLGSSYPPGIYIVRLQHSTHSEALKIMIE